MKSPEIARISWIDTLRHRLGKTAAGRRRVERRLQARGRSDRLPIGLAACLVFRDEADYLKEWLEFHDRVGFEHFFLYDHRSTDDWKSRIPAHLLEHGRVTLVSVTADKPQILAYNHCLRAARGRVRWLALLDADEFLYPVAEGRSLADILAEFDAAPAVAVNWQMFGTNGHVVRPDGGVVENFRSCAADGNRHVKILVQPELTIRVVNPHQALFVGGRTAVNEVGVPVEGPHSVPPSIAKLRINHYWTKSVEEYFLKKLKRGDAMGGQRSARELIESERRCVDPSDDRALRFVESPPHG